MQGRLFGSRLRARMTALIVGPGYNSTSDQQQWLQRDLAAVNRTQTPWQALRLVPCVLPPRGTTCYSALSRTTARR